MVVRKSKNLFEFDDDFQANRCYTMLKERVKGGKVGLPDLDRIFKELYGVRYKSNIPPMTVHDWVRDIKPDDLLLRVYNKDYATIYIREDKPEEEPKVVAFEDQKLTIEDLKEGLAIVLHDEIERYLHYHPYLKDDIMGTYLMVKIRKEQSKGLLDVKNIVVCKEVK